VRPRASFCDEFVPHLAREGQVDERVAVEMAELALPEAELGPAEAGRCRARRPPRHHTAAAIRTQRPTLSLTFLNAHGRCQGAIPTVVRVVRPVWNCLGAVAKLAGDFGG
jgi:hypothetical protein